MKPGLVVLIPLSLDWSGEKFGQIKHIHSFCHGTPFWWSKLKEICVKKDPTTKKGKVENPKTDKHRKFSNDADIFKDKKERTLNYGTITVR